jgi:hypothetical protein
MNFICYKPRRFAAEALAVIDRAVEIITKYEAEGFDLTLRQLYYAFVARGLIANKDTEYKRLGSIINDARLAGLVPWDAITDRTRNVRMQAHWENPGGIIEACAKQFKIDKWANQPIYCEVWIEKDALVGVLDSTCPGLDVPYFSCRGYTSQSEMWSAAMRFVEHIERGQDVRIIHLGDHDPSGIDMTRDIRDRLSLFIEHHVEDGAAHLEVNRVALNMDQIEEHRPPPNPAKISDSRSTEYIKRFGSESWELDALEPTVLRQLIEDEAAAIRDEAQWRIDREKEHGMRHELTLASSHWDEAVTHLKYMHEKD